MALIEFTDKGLYCRKGDFYVDPWKPVNKAIITHAHSDHARWGSASYLCHHHTKPLLQARLGDQSYDSIEWNEKIHLNGVIISLHPAGHMIGSSQIRIESNGEVWVVSGDYKTENDGISGKFEPIRCHTFITESTFGLPIYSWRPQAEIFSSIQEWVLKNKDAGKTSVVIAYSLGKAQRLLPCLTAVTEKIFVHGAIWNMQEALANAGWKLPRVIRITPETSREELKGSVVIAPSSAESSPWIKRFTPYSVGVCSGWMEVRGNVRRRNVDAGFALSDHADWKGLLEAIKLTHSEQVYVTHGFQAAFSRYLNEIGISSAEVKTEFGTEDEGAPNVAAEENTEELKDDSGS